MTNEEKALELMPTKCGDYEIMDALLNMAEWKDEQFAKGKQALIDKACKWMADFLENHYIMRYDNCCEPWKDSLAEEFKQAMKGE